MRLFGSKQVDRLELLAPASGEVVALTDVPDPVFAGEMLGVGFAIIPTDGLVRAPVSGTVEGVLDTQHAVYLTGPSGMQMLIHIGLETVNLKGRHFVALVKAGDLVEAGQPLVQFDLPAIIGEGYQPHIPVCLVSAGPYGDLKVRAGETVAGGTTAATVRQLES